MSEIATAYVQIKPSAKGISGSISDVLDGEASAAGKSAGLNIAGSLGKMLTGAIAAAGISDIVQKALDVGGNLQQSFGGLDTIYGDASDRAKRFAAQAAQMGISANNYAEQAVSFGAALKQALGGDVEAAVNVANLAISDMADNAAKMGTPIENLQTAYQGFAKQNYTMLDNLKLGYGGTKTEMERLLKDAEKLSGEEFNIENLDDVYTAIHVIQNELGLTGVAADEAKTTLQGSMNAMKASFENLLGAIATGGDIATPLTQLLTNIGTFVIGNLVPMLANIVKAIPPVLQQLFSTLAPQIGSLFSDTMNNLPDLLNAGLEMVNKIVNGILQGLPGFIAKAGELLISFVSALLSNLPAVMQAGFDILLNLVNGIISNLPAIIDAALKAITAFDQMLLKNFPTILQKGIELIAQLVAGIISAIPKVVMAIPQVIKSIVNAFSSFNWLSIGADIMRGIGNGIRNGIGIVVDAAKSAAKAAFDAAKNFLGIGSPSKLFEKGVGKWIPAGTAKGVLNNLGVLENAMTTLAATTASGFESQLTSGRFSVSEDTGTVGTNGFNQVLNIYSPRELMPSEIARQTRNATQQMALELRGV